MNATVKSKFQAWWWPPESAHDEAQRLSHLLKRLIQLLWLGTASTGLLVSVALPERLDRLALVLGAIIIFIGSALAYWLLQWGRMRWASWALSASVLTAIVFQGAVFGTEFLLPAAYLAVVVIAALFLGPPGVLGFGLASLAAYAGVVAVNLWGVFNPPTPPETLVREAFVTQITLMGAIALLYLTMRHLAQVLGHSRQTEANLHQLAAQHQSLLDLSQRLMTTLTLDELIHYTLQAIAHNVRSNGNAFYWVDEGQGVLRAALLPDGYLGQWDLGNWNIPLGAGVLGRAAVNGQAECVNNAQADPRSIYPTGVVKPATEHLIILPLRAQGQTLAVLVAGRMGREALPFTPADFEQAQLLMGQAALAVRNAQLFAETQTSEARFRALAENFPRVMYQCRNDPRYTLLYISDEVETLTGYAPREFLSGQMSFTELYHPDDAPLLASLKENERPSLAPEPFRHEYRLRHRSGEWRWVEEQGASVFDAQGQFLYLEGFLLDITARKQAELERQQTSERWRRLIELARPVVAALEVDPLLQQMLHTFQQVLGRDDLCGVYWLDPVAGVLHPRVFTAAEPLLSHLMSLPLRVGEGLTGAVALNQRAELVNNAQLDARVLYPAGTEWPIEHFIALPMLGPEGLVGVFAISRQGNPPFTQSEFELAQVFIGLAAVALENARLFAEREQAEQEIRRLNSDLERRVIERAAEAAFESSLLKALMDQMPDNIYFKDVASRFTRLNPAQARLLGVAEPAQALGQTDADFQDPALAQQFLAEEAELMRTGEPVLNRVEYNPKADGQPRWFSTSKVPLRDRQGRVFGLVGISREITDMMLTELALRRSNADLERFASAASHDLQEPLWQVIRFTQLLAKRYQGRLDAEADEFIGFIVEGAHRMSDLVKGVLEYSRVGRNDHTFAPVDCQWALDTALANLQLRLDESGGKVTHDSLPTVTGIAILLAQLFQNFISNALKFRGDAPPRIHLGVRREPPAETGAPASGALPLWQFSVRDNGIGIEPQYFEQIFVIFKRLHTRDEYAGTGIGLALCKRIVERHGGRIWVESTPGHGTTFYFTLPPA